MYGKLIKKSYNFRFFSAPMTHKRVFSGTTIAFFVSLDRPLSSSAPTFVFYGRACSNNCLYSLTSFIPQMAWK